MKPHPFRYVAPRSLDEALDALGDFAGSAKVLAGGQSLMPLLNFRISTPEVLIDINELPGVDRPERTPGGWRIPALVRHRTVERSEELGAAFPALAEAIGEIAHPQIRNRGTVCGSLAHADAAAELPAVMTALDARMRLVSRRGERFVPAADFFQFHLTTALEDDELLLDVTIPDLAPDVDTAFAEFAPRHGDFALAAVTAVVRGSGDGEVTDCHLVASGVAPSPLRLTGAEAALSGRRLDAAAISAAESAARAEVTPADDIHGSSGYRRQLVATLVRRTLGAIAAGRDEGER